MYEIIYLLPCICLLLKLSPLGADPHPDCVPASLLAECKKAKCQMNQLQNCETLVSAYPGGNQCCDQDTLAELKNTETVRGSGWLNGKNGHDGINGWFGSNGQNGGHGGKRRKRQAYNFDTNPTAQFTSPITVHINFVKSSSYVDNIKYAVAHIEEKTCLEFVYSTTAPATAHISFNLHTEGCASFVGKSNKIASPIFGDETCYSKPGNLINLLTQTLGLWHQTQRPDRDQYLEIDYDNLLQSHQADFQKVNTAYISTAGMPYDHASVTQLPAKVYSSNGQPTIIPANAEFFLAMGQRVELSYQDAKTLNKLYCSEECTTPLTCNNGGYQDYTNCASCRCPEGFGGLNCTMAVTAKTVLTTNDCGGVLEATTTPAFVTSPGYAQGNYPENTECQWIIKGPGGKVELKFEGDFKVYADELSVCQHWVEVKYNTPLNTTGPRFCGSRVPDSAISSSSSDVIVVFKSNNVGKAIEQQKGFRLSYKLIDFEACKSSPCKNGGVCLRINNGYICICSNKTAGVDCEIDLSTTPNQCNFNPCMNNGTCLQENSTSFTCICLSNFYGVRCEKANCGGCSNNYNCYDKQCKVGFSPPKNCTSTRSRYRCRWRWGCMEYQYNITRECVKEKFCCDNAVKIRNRCASLGWTGWFRCSRRCGGGTTKRYNYGIKNDEYRIVGEETKKCNEEACQRVSCNWYRRWMGLC